MGVLHPRPWCGSHQPSLDPNTHPWWRAVQVLTPLQQAQLLVGAQPYKVDMLSFCLAALGQHEAPPLPVVRTPFVQCACRVHEPSGCKSRRAGAPRDLTDAWEYEVTQEARDTGRSRCRSSVLLVGHVRRPCLVARQAVRIITLPRLHSHCQNSVWPITYR